METAPIKETLERLLQLLELPFETIALSQEGDVIRADIASPQASRLIGWHGETLNAVQHLLKVILQAGKDEKAPFVVLDVDGYRRLQEDKVREMVQRKADFVRRTKSRVALPPMSPYFRRVAHVYVTNDSELQDLTTESTGEGEYRQVVLRLKAEKGLRSGEELTPVMADTSWENLDV